MGIIDMRSFNLLKLAAAFGLALAAPAIAQITQIDPNDAGAYDASAPSEQPVPDNRYEQEYQPIDQSPAQSAAPAPGSNDPAPLTPPSDTVPREDIFSAAEGVFGKGAEGLAGVLEKILKDQGEPIAYIAGQEAGGALIVGLRYGSGTMRHQVEGDRAVHWTGPSIGFDAGADASKVFVLVYNLYDAQQLFNRFAAVEGRAYAVGGFTASYLRRGDVVLIPVRLGVGLRLGANVGYMKFSEKNEWMPF
jgi:hypothetical protein